MVKSDDIIERNKLSVIGCWLNNTSLFWQITIHWNSGYIEAHRMKKFIFFDIVSFALCLESLILQQGADSSMVDGKFIGCRINIIKVNKKSFFDYLIVWEINYQITPFFNFSEEFRDAINSNSYSDYHWIYFTNRHKRELGHASFHPNGNQNGKEVFSFIQLF